MAKGSALNRLRGTDIEVASDMRAFSDVFVLALDLGSRLAIWKLND
jgi:hypothetical protein